MIVLDALRLGFLVEAPQVHENLTIYPLIGHSDIKADYLTLDEALIGGLVEIREVGGGRVSKLLVINRSQKDLLIVSGEELIGAMQNRTINVTIMMSALSSLEVPVSCTERGRWREGRHGVRVGGTSRHFSSSGLRAKIVSSSASSLSEGTGYDSDQLDVWDIIDNTMMEFNVSSDTLAQSDIFAEKKEIIDDYLKYFHLLPNQFGLIGLINGRITSLELFGKADTFSRMFDKLIRSLVLDAISKKGKPVQTNESVMDLLEDLKEAKLESYKALGKGEHLIIETPNQKGMALLVDSQTVHLLISSKLYLQ